MSTNNFNLGLEALNYLCYTVTQSHSHTNTRENGGVTMNDRNMVNITVTMTREERKALKQMALDRDTTASALIRKWLKEYQNKEQEVRNNGEY